jgi:hypothetical protein
MICKVDPVKSPKRHPKLTAKPYIGQECLSTTSWYA